MLFFVLCRVLKGCTPFLQGMFLKHLVDENAVIVAGFTHLGVKLFSAFAREDVGAAAQVKK